MNISFVVTVLDETDSLMTTVEAILRLAGDDVLEVLIVTAPRTTPSSRSVISTLMDRHRGYIRVHEQQLPFLGGALQEAFRQARGDYIMVMASDLETDPAAIPQFITTMKTGDWDIVAGSRWVKGGGFEGYNPLKLCLNFVFQNLFRVLYRTRLTDLTFGFRLYRRSVLEGIAWEELRHPFLLECLIKPLRRGARAAEVPCCWRQRVEGASTNTFLQTLHYLRTAVKTRLVPIRRFSLPARSEAGSVPEEPSDE